MNEAPEKIWLDSDMTAWKQYSEDDTPYIRADIVDELVEALVYCQRKIEYMRTHGEWYSPGRASEKAEAALAKYRGEDE